MRTLAWRGVWGITVTIGAAWAAGCGHSDGSHPPGAGATGGDLAGAPSAGKGASGGTGGTSGAGTSGSTARGGSSGATATQGGSSGTEAGGTPNDAGAAGETAQGATAGESSTAGTSQGGGGTVGNAGAGGEGGASVEPPPFARASKLDMLFVIDNSISMFEKQALLAATIPKLVGRLLDPWCVGGSAPPAPPGAGDLCPPGSQREFAPIRDMHVGVVTTSLGAHGSHDVCSEEQNAANVSAGAAPSDYDDKAHLLPFVRASDDLPSWNGSGFLNWDPDGHATPAGTSNPQQFVDDLGALMGSVGSTGCGYETTLEAMYRFLVDPEPPLVIGSDGNVTTVSTSGSNTDSTVLDERAAFLRPDSALVIVTLSDEDDCSIDDTAGHQGWLVGYKGGVGKSNFHMPRASAACSADPNSHCCSFCSTLPSDCPADPSCSTAFLSPSEDSLNLRCFDQKRRFGVDLLYPLDRYVTGLSAPKVPRRSGGSAPNPLFADGRDPRLVVFMPIVGVPWQDLARNPSDATRLDLMSAGELASAGHWPAIVGDFANAKAPSDPFMVPAVDPRTNLTPNKNPYTNQPIVDATSTNPEATINGHEQAATSQRDDLQYACTFRLGTPVDCSSNSDDCDCTTSDQTQNRPICQPPAGGASTTTQYYGKAYPGVRHLEVARRLQDNAVVASICARNTTDSTRDDYSYLPAMRALQARLSVLLKAE